MKKSPLGFACFFVIFFLGKITEAQTIKLKISPQLIEPPKTVLSAETKATLLKTIETTLNEYAAVATLMDEKKKRVSGESIKKFQEFFQPSATLPKDFLENVPEEPVSFKDYASAVFNYMAQEGVQVRIVSATLTEIANDASGYFVPVVKLEKEFYTSLDSKSRVQKNTSPRRLEQDVFFDINKNELSKAKIAKIKYLCKTKDCQIKADFVQYAGFSFGINYGLVSPKYAQTWETNHAQNSTLKASQDLGISVGYEWFSNKMMSKNSQKKNLFLSVGFRTSFHLMAFKLNDFSILPFSAEATDPKNVTGNYARSGDNIKVTEKLKLGFIELPIGIGFRVKNGQSKSIITHLRLIPSFAVFGKATGSGSGDYIAALPMCNWISNKPNALNPNDPDFAIFDAGTGTKISESPKLKKGGIGLAVQISPTIYTDRTDDDPTNALLIGFDFTFNLGSFIGHKTNNTDLFQYSNAYGQPVAQQYLSGMTVFSAGIKFGLVKKTSTKS